MRRKRGIYISAGFILMFSALFFFDTSGIVSAIAAAVAIHELGHVAALYALGAKPTLLTAGLGGLRLDYARGLTPLGEFIAAFCGPLAGILAAVIMSYAALRVPSEFLLCTAGVSFVLSVFNLIPAGPLDGGRILHVILQKLFGERFADRALLLCGAVCSLALFYLGLWFLARGDGLALALAGLWLFICVITGDAPRRARRR